MTVTTKSAQTRQKILHTGRALVLSGGFVGVGLKQILVESGVPKGSFYYYFDSKEAFGCALLQDYVDEYLARLDAIIALPDSAAQRLMHYLQPAQNDSACIAERCLIVKLAAEISDLYDSMRIILDAGVVGIVARLTLLLEAGQADGSLRSDNPSDEAASLYSQWLGAAVLTKLSQQPSFLQNAVADTQRRFVIQ